MNHFMYYSFYQVTFLVTPCILTAVFAQTVCQAQQLLGHSVLYSATNTKHALLKQIHKLVHIIMTFFLDLTFVCIVQNACCFKYSFAGLSLQIRYTHAKSYTNLEKYVTCTLYNKRIG